MKLNQNIEPDRRLSVTVAEAAKMLGVSQKTVYRLMDRGLIKASRALRTYLISIKELERFLESTTVTNIYEN